MKIIKTPVTVLNILNITILNISPSLIMKTWEVGSFQHDTLSFSLFPSMRCHSGAERERFLRILLSPFLGHLAKIGCVWWLPRWHSGKESAC